MKRSMRSVFWLVALVAAPLFGAEPTASSAPTADKQAPAKTAAKPAERSALGMSVTGTLEAPKVLYIVPWKTLDAVPAEPYVSGLMDEVFSPVDPVVFERGVQQFEQRQQAEHPTPAADK